MPLPSAFSEPVLHHHHHHHQPKPPPPELNLEMSPSTPTPAAMFKTPVPGRSSTRSSTTGFIPKIFPRRYGSAYSDSGLGSPLVTSTELQSSFSPNTPTPTHPRSSSGSSTPPIAPASAKKKNFKRKWAARKKADYNLSASNDILGIVMLEIQGASDLPRLKNSQLP
jgi:phosphatidylserine decarboxylase